MKLIFPPTLRSREKKKPFFKEKRHQHTNKNEFFPNKKIKPFWQTITPLFLLLSFWCVVRGGNYGLPCWPARSPACMMSASQSCAGTERAQTSPSAKFLIYNQNSVKKKKKKKTRRINYCLSCFLLSVVTANFIFFLSFLIFILLLFLQTQCHWLKRSFKCHSIKYGKILNIFLSIIFYK